LAYDEGYLDEDCEEIDALPAQQMEPFFMDNSQDSFMEEDCEDEDINYEPAFPDPPAEQRIDEYEDCEDEDIDEQPAFVDQALNMAMPEYEMEDCVDEEQEFLNPAAALTDNHQVENFYDEECEDEDEILPAIANQQVFTDQEADCEDEGEYLEPHAAGPSDPFSVDVLDAAEHAYVMKPEFIAGNQLTENFEDCEDEPLLK